LSHYGGANGGILDGSEAVFGCRLPGRILRQVELDLATSADVAKACRTAGITDATHYTWRKKFGWMTMPQLTELKALEKENKRLKEVVVDLELDK